MSSQTSLKNNFHYTTVAAAEKNLYLQNSYNIWRQPNRRLNYTFSAHFHPYTDELIEKLNKDGLEALLDVNYLQTLQYDLSLLYHPSSTYISKFPKKEIDVSDDGPYAVYNWELFFHVPLAVAVHLSNNQKFEDARRWFHFIFDPTSTDTTVPAPQRFWKFLRFRQETKTEFIQELLTQLSMGNDNELKERIEKSIQAWRDKPFQPHVIARGRYLAYQMNVIMKYLDNLIAWGDSLFRQDTMETTNEATQLYVLAANILGPKPQKIPPRRKMVAQTYAQLKAAGLDAFSNAMVEMENDFPFNTSPTTTNPGSEDDAAAVFGIGRSLYFCIPQNDQLLQYWDTVGDRLFKLRHCMNIEGQVRQLSLFAPPIDPGMLVKAVAAGLDISSIISNLNQPVSNIRGPLILQKALEICNEVRALGSNLLAAIEKGDAERIGLMRQQHETNLLKLMQDVKFVQWKEAEAATEALLKSRSTTFERYKHYKLILGNQESDIDKLKTINLTRTILTEDSFDSVYADWVSQYAIDITKEPYRQENSVGGLMEFAGNVVTSIAGGQLGKTLPLNKNENAELNIFLPSSDTFNALSMALRLATPILALVPQFNAHGTPLGVGAAVGFGGVELSKAAKFGSEISKEVANAFASSAERAAKMASYYRRAEDYVLQANLAGSDLMQSGRQIISSLIREQITQRDYENHQKQIEQAEALETFMQDKFTNEELYTWMQGELSKVYYDCYQFAFDTAKRAEQTMKYELMRSEFDALDFIKFDYWDGGRKGLLAGEALYLDLKRLEMAYFEHNSREYELTKHISLRRLAPMALLQLKATGSCTIDVPEWLFDMESPGQYMRRLKTVALTVPCVAGPYTGIHCKLSLLSSSLRISSLAGDQYERNATGEDIRFRDFAGAIQSMVTSTAQNDSGLFELNLRDERHLPFEGAGAVSSWRIELPNEVPQFDFDSISDVILHFRYTAREAGQLTQAAVDYLQESVLQSPDHLLQLFSLNYDFSTAWYRFVNAANDNDRQLTVVFNKDYFPYWVKSLGVDDQLVVSFCTIDFDKHKLILASSTITPNGNQNDGWTISIDKDAAVFNFLKKNRTNKVYMAVAYMMAS